MKQKIITFTKKIQFDADIELELNENELSKRIGKGWTVKQVSSQVYFKPKGKDINYQYVLYSLLVESIKHPDSTL